MDVYVVFVVDELKITAVECNLSEVLNRVRASPMTETKSDAGDILAVRRCRKTNPCLVYISIHFALVNSHVFSIHRALRACLTSASGCCTEPTSCSTQCPYSRTLS